VTGAARKTPVRRALRDDSSLLDSVQDGLGAVESAHRDYFAPSIRTAFADSLDLDKALKPGRERENRWDYLLGHTASGQVVAVEPHSAKDDEIGTVIRKQKAAREQLREQLRDGAKVARWLWVASGKVRFAATEKAKLRLDQHGIEFAGKQVTTRHLPPTSAAAPASRSSRRTGRR
jgi:hypothetical protein